MSETVSLTRVHNSLSLRGPSPPDPSSASRLRCDCILIRTSVSAIHPKSKALKTFNFEIKTVKTHLLATAEMNVDPSRRTHTNCQIRKYDGQFKSKRQGQCRSAVLGERSSLCEHEAYDPETQTYTRTTAQFSW